MSAGMARTKVNAREPRKCAGGNDDGVAGASASGIDSFSTANFGSTIPPGSVVSIRNAPNDPSTPKMLLSGGAMPRGTTPVAVPRSRPLLMTMLSFGSTAATTFIVAVPTSPENRKPVVGSTSGGSVPRTRCATDFQMILGSSAPTSSQSASDGGAARDSSAFFAVGNSSAEQLAVRHTGSAATFDDSSIFVRSTSSTRPAPSTITPRSLSGITRTEYAPAGIQTTSASESQLRAPALKSTTSSPN